MYLFEVSRIWHDNPRLPLDGLAHEGAHVGVGQRLGEGGHVVERYALEPIGSALTVIPSMVYNGHAVTDI